MCTFTFDYVEKLFNTPLGGRLPLFISLEMKTGLKHWKAAVSGLNAFNPLQKTQNNNNFSSSKV